MEQMTVKEVIRITMNQLLGISVPRSLNEQIGVPIDRAIGNLQACLNAIDKAEEEKKEEQPDGDTDAE